MNDLSGFDTPVLVLLGVLFLIEIGLLVAAVVDITRKPGPLAGEKLLWLLVSLLLNGIGPILYFAIGRRRLLATAPAVEVEAPSADTARSAVDSLYGVGDSELPPPPPVPGDETSQGPL